MDPDEIVIEYLRGKLAKARGARADNILKPPEAAQPPPGDEDPEQMAQLEALMQEGSPAEEGAESPTQEATETCPECGAPMGQCQHTKAM